MYVTQEFKNVKVQIVFYKERKIIKNILLRKQKITYTHTHTHIYIGIHIHTDKDSVN